MNIIMKNTYFVSEPLIYYPFEIWQVRD